MSEPVDAATQARALLAGARAATLGTLARDPPGWPYASLVAVAFDEASRALLLLSSLAEHTGNLVAHPEVSLLVVAPGEADPLAGPRVTVLGRAERLDGTAAVAARARYLALHPGAARFVDFADFAFYAVVPIRARWIGGFGRQAWVELYTESR